MSKKKYGTGFVAYIHWNWRNEETEEIVKGNGTLKISHTNRLPNDYIITVLAYGDEGKQLGLLQAMNVEIYSCVLPVNPHIYLMK